MNVFNLFLLLSFSITIISCGDFYTSEVPISNSGNTKIDTNVIGAWAAFKEDGKLDEAIKISSIDDYSYIVNFISFTKTGERLNNYDNFIAYSYTINKQEYINMRMLNCPEKESYIFYKYELKDDSLFTYLLSEEKFKKKFKSSKRFKKYIKENSGDFNDKFEQSYRFVKIYPSPK